VGDVRELLAGHASAVLANLERTVELAEANRELRQARDEAQRQALHDSLTGLPNRTLLRDRLQQALLIGDRDKTSVALLIMDLDRFKDVNDTLGHHTGDELLQQVGVRLRSIVRASDTVARMGGDEFVLVLEGLSGETREAAIQARMVAEKIREAVARPCQLGGFEISSSASIGIALFRGHDALADALASPRTWPEAGSDEATTRQTTANRSKGGHEPPFVWAAEQERHKSVGARRCNVRY